MKQGENLDMLRCGLGTYDFYRNLSPMGWCAKQCAAKENRRQLHLRELPGCANSFIKSVNWVNK